MSSHWDGYRLIGPCLCGNGQITLHVEDENYPPFRTNCHVKIGCEKCETEYHIWTLDCGHLSFSRRSDHKAAAEACTIRNAAWHNEPDVVRTSKELRILLDREKSLAARHRKLLELNLYPYNVRTFRQEWRANPDRTVERIIYANGSRLKYLEDAWKRFEDFVVPEIPSWRVKFAGKCVDDN
jgi:hypothetical protein